LDFLDLKPFSILRERIEELLGGVVTLLPNFIALTFKEPLEVAQMTQSRGDGTELS